MKILRSVISLYEGVFKNENTIPVYSNLNEKEKKAVDIILNNNLLTDDLLKAKLSFEIYNSKPDNPTFRSFISTLEKKSILIASMATSKGSKIQKIRFEIQKEYSALQKLVMLGLYEPGVRLGKKLYKKSVFYQDYKTALNVVEILFQNKVSFGTEKEVQHWHELYVEISEICKTEHDIKLKFAEVLNATKNKSISQLQKRHFLNYMNYAETVLDNSSSDFHYFFYQIKLKLCNKKDYAFWCNHAIKYFENLYFNHAAFVSIFRRRLLHYKFENDEISISTLKLLNEIIDKEKQYTNSWYRYVHTLVKVLLNLNDYDNAIKWINKVIKSKKYRFIPKDHRNEWQLIQMYYHLMKGEFDEVNIRKIKYNLNYTTTTKSSNNIPFLIGELIYLLKTGEQDLDRKINHLRNQIKSQCQGNELERGLGFCDAVQKGQKFIAKKAETSFENEYVFYEKLLEKV